MFRQRFLAGNRWSCLRGARIFRRLPAPPLSAKIELSAGNVRHAPRLKPPPYPNGKTTPAAMQLSMSLPVKQNKSGLPPSGDRQSSNFPLDDGDAYVPNGGPFPRHELSFDRLYDVRLQNHRQSVFLSAVAIAEVGDCRRVYDIQARASGNPSKDQMRLMMQSLLTDRFKLAVHGETRRLPVFATTLIKPGKPGPQLLRHTDDVPCAAAVPLAPGSALPTTDSGLPALCGVLSRAGSVPTSAQIRLSGRNMTLQVIGSYLGSIAQVGRPVIDGTGLEGKFDFIVNWTSDLSVPGQPSGDQRPDKSAPTFFEALKDQTRIETSLAKWPGRRPTDRTT